MSGEKYVSEAEIRRRAEKNLEYWPAQGEEELLVELQKIERRKGKGAHHPWKQRDLDELAELAEEIL